MIDKLKNIFKSTIKSLEILYVLENNKPVARILVNEEDLDLIKDFLNKNNLELSISNFKLKKINDNSFYSDKSLKIEKNSSEKGYLIVYISKLKELVEKAKAYEENDMHLELGMILGYPKCCCEFFKEKFNEDNYDLTLNSFNDSKGYEFPFYSNIAARHFDISLLNHFPCKLDCEFSIKLGKENLKIIKKYSNQLANIFESTLKSAILYTKKDGIFLFKNYVKNDDEVTFDELLFTTKNQLFDELKKNKKIKIINKNEIEINDKEINNVGFIVFT